MWYGFIRWINGEPAFYIRLGYHLEQRFTREWVRIGIGVGFSTPFIGLIGKIPPSHSRLIWTAEVGGGGIGVAVLTTAYLDAMHMTDKDFALTFRYCGQSGDSCNRLPLVLLFRDVPGQGYILRTQGGTNK